MVYLTTLKMTVRLPAIPRTPKHAFTQSAFHQQLVHFVTRGLTNWANTGQWHMAQPQAIQGKIGMLLTTAIWNQTKSNQIYIISKTRHTFDMFIRPLLSLSLYCIICAYAYVYIPSI